VVADTKGSQKWLRLLINHAPELVNRELGRRLDFKVGETVQWLSPLKKDNYHEYSDQKALDRFCSLEYKKRPLKDFWPPGGPHWDALATTTVSHKVILVEAKAYIAEMKSGRSNATHGASKELIKRSIQETKDSLASELGGDWNEPFYQYANRLSFLHFLRTINGNKNTYLLFLYFVNADVPHPATREQWEGAIELLDLYLGIKKRHRVIKEGVLHVFIDVNDILKAIET